NPNNGYNIVKILGRSRAGARIETSQSSCLLWGISVAPAQERGLKPPRPRSVLYASGVAPAQERGLCESFLNNYTRVHLYAVVERLWIGDYCPWVPGCLEELPNEVVLPNRFGTGHIERAVQRLREGHFGHDGTDVIGRYGLHQDRWKPNLLSFSRGLGDA